MALDKDFLWGGALAAHQFEGGVLNTSKGLSVADVMTAGAHGVIFLPGHDKGIDRHDIHGLIRQPADHQRRPGNRPFKICQFFRNIPGQPVIESEHAITRDRADRRNHRRIAAHCARFRRKEIAGVPWPL